MKTTVAVILGFANVAALVVLLSVLSAGQALQLSVQDLISVHDLKWGAIDVDGDGKYTLAESYTVEQLLLSHPSVVEEALKTARVNPDGGVDLSAYLMQFGLRGDTATLYRDGEVVDETVVSEE